MDAIEATWTEYDLQVLTKAIASGARSVQYSNDKKVDYRDLDEMLRVQALIVAYLNKENGTSTNNRVIETVYSR